MQFGLRKMSAPIKRGTTKKELILYTIDINPNQDKLDVAPSKIINNGLTKFENKGL